MGQTTGPQSLSAFDWEIMVGQKTSTLEIVIDTVATVLDVNANTISESSSVETLDSWDSMAQLNIILTLESRLNMSIDPIDIAELLSVSELTSFLNSKLS